MAPESTSPAASADRGARMNIGEVLELLHEDFPSISIPKIRFLEEKGIVTPDRTSSGYRKFSHADVERLRYALLLQRDHHQPLARIVEILDAIDRGLEPPPLVDLNPTVPDVALSADGLPSPESFRRHDDLRLSRRELLKIAEIDEALLDQLEQYALVVPRRGTGHYDSDALVICTTARELADFGLEPRHLRAFKTAAAAPGLGSCGVGASRGHGLPARRTLGADARDAGQDGAPPTLNLPFGSRPGCGHRSRVKACAKWM
jgi:DNA-binding transcriptional MerR regulator